MNTMQPETVMAEAFVSAGVFGSQARLHVIAEDVLAAHPKDWQSSETVQYRRGDALNPKLRDIAVEALLKSKNNWDAARDAVFSAVRSDAGLLWALFEPYRAVAVQKLLADVAAEARAHKDRAETPEARGGGHSNSDDHAGRAPTPRQTNGASSGAHRSGEGHVAGDDHTAGALPARPSAAVGRAAKDAAAVAVAARTIYDTFLIDGKPLGQCVGIEVRRWGDAQGVVAKDAGRNSRFAEMLTKNLPGNEVVSRFVKPEEAEEYYRRAMSEETAHAA